MKREERKQLYKELFSEKKTIKRLQLEIGDAYDNDYLLDQLLIMRDKINEVIDALNKLI